MPFYRLCSIEKPSHGNFFCLSGHKLLCVGKSLGFWKPLNFLNFLKIYKIKSEMKGSTDRNGCDIVSGRSGNSLIFEGENLSPFKNWLSQNFLFISIIIVEK